MYKKEKSQALMISLWILVILTILAISIGRQVSMALYLSKYQRNRLKAISLAKAGINRAIIELERDVADPNTKDYDSLNETWSTGKDSNDNNIFEDIEIVKDSGEKFTVCITDEERKINLNNTNKQLLKQELIELFIIKEIFSDESEAGNLANIVIDWIESSPETEVGRENFKNGPLGIPEELLPILEYYYEPKVGVENYRRRAHEVYDKIKDLITVYGDGQVNINTAHEDVLEALAIAVAKLNGKNEALAQSLIPQIIAFISENPFKDQGTLNSTEIGKEQEEKDIFNLMKGYLMIKSNYFKVESLGRVGNVTKNIIAIYDRGSKKIIYWHEN